jgi:predicted AAA+ superfamily ATPase
MQFLQFVSVVASRTSQLLNYSDISKDCGISEVTAKKWISLLVSSGLVYLLQPYSTNIEKRIVKTPKIYFMDTGLAAFLTRWTNPDVMRTGAMAGAFFETYGDIGITSGASAPEYLVDELIRKLQDCGWELAD